MERLREILNDLVSETVRRRGYEYFLDDAVLDLEYSADRAVAVVQGTSLYDVEIGFDKDGYPTELWCSCPYIEKGICKHIVAVLYELDSRNFYKMSRSNSRPHNSADHGTGHVEGEEKQIEPLTKKEWVEILQKRDEAARFSQFKNRVSGLIRAKGKKPEAKPSTICYVISPEGNNTTLQAVRLVPGTGDTLQAVKSIYGSDFSISEELPLAEKVLIQYLQIGYGSITVDLPPAGRHRSYSRERGVNAQIFSDILSFLSEKETFIGNRYKFSAQRVFVQKDTASATVVVEESEKNISLTLRLNFHGENFKPGTEIIPVLDVPLWVMAEDKIFRVENLTYDQFLTFDREPSAILIPKEYMGFFEENVLPQLLSDVPVESSVYSVEKIAATPRKRMFLDEDASTLRMTLKFHYGGYDVPYDKTQSTAAIVAGKTIVQIARDRDYEDTARSEITSLYVKEVAPGVFAPRNNPVAFLIAAIPKLKEAGFDVFGEADLKKFKVNLSSPSFSFAVTSGIDWFDVTSRISFDGTPLPLDALLEAIKHKKEYVQLADGSTGILPVKWLNKFKRAMAFAQMTEDGLRFSKVQTNAIDMLVQESEEFAADGEFRTHLENLNSFERITAEEVPAGFAGSLRPYQKFGYDWLCFLNKFRFGGILADDMGLGKTIQTLAFLCREKEAHLTRRKDGETFPNLIVAPTSVVFNWISEASRFSPELKVLNHTGIDRTKDGNTFLDFDIVLTNYAILLRDANLFSESKFNYLILDESQKIKNPMAKSSKFVRTLKAEHRLCLTGTPVENNLDELWSQMTFLNPGMLGSLTKFQETFVKPVIRKEDSAAEFLRRTVYPFILRRTKEVVAKELPEKTEIIQYCEMEPEQKKIYDVWRNSIRREIMTEIAAKGIRRSGFKVIEGLLRLRQICNHPTLVKKAYENKSGKFEEFKEQLEEVLEENHKVLVFSQFVKMLEVMRKHLEKEKISYEYLDGQTHERENHVKNFQENENIKVFLISLKAGGFGLNLTAADYVFHYDPWWNPAVESQATDRAHRIGQDKNVFVYKFITKNSVEEKILQLQARKRQLVENIISAEKGIVKDLTKEDVEMLLG